jgi:hypothetical protein
MCNLVPAAALRQQLEQSCAIVWLSSVTGDGQSSKSAAAATLGLRAQAAWCPARRVLVRGIQQACEDQPGGSK